MTFTGSPLIVFQFVTLPKILICEGLWKIPSIPYRKPTIVLFLLPRSTLGFTPIFLLICSFSRTYPNVWSYLSPFWVPHCWWYHLSSSLSSDSSRPRRPIDWGGRLGKKEKVFPSCAPSIHQNRTDEWRSSQNPQTVILKPPVKHEKPGKLGLSDIKTTVLKDSWNIQKTPKVTLSKIICFRCICLENFYLERDGTSGRLFGFPVMEIRRISERPN